ncbi:glycoside hydrolase family 28 protein [Breznakiella homolactica]|uniref:Glycoside hydrolase family 28 protein n=1 Tax=Breznakiella homolactica TaxID=2798577 RepID=A0A7T8BBW7_9SPIR|nr:glycoside hydrolase family 28 protein [Breznakiella homolactica]QQO10821.1 glycoside hydrolase family 28 protein [Breznakiella homolactica]
MKSIDLNQYSGVPDGKTDNSAAFKNALEALRDAGGGVLTVGPGTWMTGPVELFSNTTLELDEKALVRFIPEPELYQPVLTRWEGIECYGMHPCVFASGQENITIRGGRFDCGGQVWWEILDRKRRSGQKEPVDPIEKKIASLNPGYTEQPGGGGGREIQFLRPPAIQFFSCKKIRLETFHVSNSPFWTVHPVYCDNIVIDGIKITNPHNSPNTDGIDIDSCTDVTIINCDIGVGDDGIVLKSGSGKDGIRVNRPTRKVHVKNCTVGDGHGGIVIGSETAGGIFDVLAEDCTFSGTDRGIRIKTRRSRGGAIENLRFRNLVLTENLCPFVINMYYRCGASLEDGYFSLDAQPVDNTTPSVKNVELVNIKATGCLASAGFIAGLPESPAENITVRDCIFSTNEESTVSPDDSDMALGIPPVREKSFRIINAKNLNFINTTVEGPAEPFLYV